MTRAEEVAAGLERVRGRIAAAETRAGREPGSVGLVVVTKFFPASDVALLADLGVTDVGESRHQEASAKAAELAGPGLSGRLRWHFVGSLQSNKAAAVAAYADVVQSLDRPKLLSGLSRGALKRGGDLEVTIQVDLDPDPKPGRGGARSEEVAALAEAAAGTEGLVLRGLMAVAPLGADPAAAFERLAALAERLRADHPSATWISAGMSGDLEAAIAAGATHVRVGGAVLGPRPMGG